MPDPAIEPPFISAADELPMCSECGAILDDDGTCPDADDHGADLLAIWAERQEPDA